MGVWVYTWVGVFSVLVFCWGTALETETWLQYLGDLGAIAKELEELLGVAVLKELPAEVLNEKLRPSEPMCTHRSNSGRKSDCTYL